MKRIKETITKIKNSNTLRVCFLVILLMFTYFEYHTSAHNSFPERYYGRPVVSTDYPEIDISIDQVLHDGKYMYILYHHSNGIVQVCDLDGVYQYTLFFYCHMNGGFSLAIDGDMLYVQDMRENVYVFLNGLFERFVKKEEVVSELGNIDFKTPMSSTDYEIRENSVWKVAEGNEICVVGMPKPNTGLSMLLTAVTCLVLVFVVIRHTTQRK